MQNMYFVYIHTSYLFIHKLMNSFFCGPEGCEPQLRVEFRFLLDVVNQN